MSDIERQILLFYHLHVELKKKKWLHISKQKQVHIHRKQTSVYQWGEEKKVYNRGIGLTDTNYYV